MEELFEDMTKELEGNIVRKRNCMEFLVIAGIEYQFSYTIKPNEIYILSYEPINRSSFKSEEWGSYVTVSDIRNYPEIIQKDMYVDYLGTIYKVMQLYGKNENEGYVVTIPGMDYEEGRHHGLNVDWHEFPFPYLDLRRQMVSKVLIKTTVVPNKRYGK